MVKYRATFNKNKTQRPKRYTVYKSHKKADLSSQVEHVWCCLWSAVVVLNWTKSYVTAVWDMLWNHEVKHHNRLTRPIFIVTVQS